MTYIKSLISLLSTHTHTQERGPSRTGLINPVAIFDPVELEGTTVSRASVHNLSIVKNLKLGEGDTITVYKANMIIPQIAENLTKRLTELAKERELMGEHFLDVEDLDEVWKKAAPEYMVDAVPEIAKYPIVAIAWASYFGLAAAILWDLDWEKYSKIPS